MPPMILGNTATISECLSLDEENTSVIVKNSILRQKNLENNTKMMRKLNKLLISH